MTDASASETDSSADLGEAVAPPEQVESEPTTAIPSMFTVKVNGEEQQVSLEEALSGYQRQADYTQKTQALSQDREQLAYAERLWNAIEANPEQTIKAIAEAYGVSLGQAQQMVDDANADPFGDVQDTGKEANSDPRWQQVEQFMQNAQMERLQAQIDRELVNIHQTYGEFDDNALLQYAVDHQIASLDDAFKSFAFDRMTQVAKDRHVQQRKQSAPPVAGGHGVAAGAVAPGTGSKQMSIEEAFAAAQAEHGLA